MTDGMSTAQLTQQQHSYMNMTGPGSVVASMETLVCGTISMLWIMRLYFHIYCFSFSDAYQNRRLQVSS